MRFFAQKTLNNLLADKSTEMGEKLFRFVSKLRHERLFSSHS